MKVNTDSGMKPNSLGRSRNRVRLRRINFHRANGAGQHNGRQPPQEREDLLPARRLSVRKTKEVLRLRFEVGLGLRAIARSCSIGLGTVHEYLQRAEAAGVKWPLGEDWNEARLETALFGGPPPARPAVLPMPDFADLHQQRQRHP